MVELTKTFGGRFFIGTPSTEPRQVEAPIPLLPVVPPPVAGGASLGVG